MTTQATNQFRLELRNVTKHYPMVVANDNVSLTLLPGQIKAVLGENGAGKSTLMKIIYGAVKPDAGEVWFNGKQVYIANPQEARKLGISMVFQHFSLFETLSVAENIWLGLDKSITLAQVCKGIEQKAKEYGLDLDPQRPMHTLSVGQRQRVEIMRALLTSPSLLILDEPTSVLTPQAVKKLFLVLQKIASQGCSILYISHKLDEIRTLCTDCTVMRGGQVTGECDPRVESNGSLSRLMINVDPPSLKRRKDNAAIGKPVLQVNHLSLPKTDYFGTTLEDISFTVHAGEIVGIAGVSGNGQQELLMALSGEDTRAAADMVLIEGKPIAKNTPVQRRRYGLHSVPEERLGRAAVPSIELSRNMLLTRNQAVGFGGWLHTKVLHTQATHILKRFAVKADNPRVVAQTLSGGNLQKYIVGREIDASPKILVVAQPTWGIDVGASALIHNEIIRLRDTGCAVLVISEELDELFALSDRLYVIAKGRLSPAMQRSKADIETIGQWMSGLWHSESEPNPVAHHA